MRLLPILIAILVVCGLHTYVGSRLVAAGMLSRSLALPILTILLAAGVAAMILGRRGFGSPFTIAIAWLGYVWLGMLLLLFAASLAGDLWWLGGQLFQFLSHRDASAAILWGRRAFASAALLAALWSLVEARLPPRVHDVEVEIPGLPAAFEGFRIAHITDTHISLLLGRSWSQSLVARINAARPDLVVHTGDFADGPVESLAPAVEPFAHLTAPHLFVTGNHESYSNLQAWTTKLRTLGFAVLDNQAYVVTRGDAHLVIGGITDFNQGSHFPGSKSDPAKAFSQVPEGPRILLAHQPRSALAAQGLHIALQLSGHTHGGQIWPWHFFVRLQQPANSGFAKLGDVLVFTSRGVGFWGPPMRLFAPPEVPVLVLRRSVSL